MKALSIRAPWWWMILHGGKDIENRSWPTVYRGGVLIHASKWFHPSIVWEDFQLMKFLLPETRPTVTLNEMRQNGGLCVGQVDIVDCVEESKSPWFMGRFGVVLKNPKPIDPFPVKGRLGFFEVYPGGADGGGV